MYRTDSCDDCPRVQWALKLERATEQEWERWFTPADLKRVTDVGFTDIKAMVYQAASISDEDTSVPFTVSHYVTVYGQEKGRFEEIERDNK